MTNIRSTDLRAIDLASNKRNSLAEFLVQLRYISNFHQKYMKNIKF